MEITVDALDELIALQQLPAAAPGTAQYTFGVVNTNARMNIRGLFLANVTGATRTITIHHTTGGAAVAASNKRWPAISIAANTIYEIGYEDGEWTMKGGDAIYLFADSATSVNVAMTGKGHE